MNPLETAAAVAYMQSCWPSATVSEDMTAVWAEQLTRVDPEDGLAAARTLMRSSKWFPSLSEFLDQTRVEARRRTGSVEGRAPAAGELPEVAASGVGRDEVLSVVARTRAHIAAVGGRNHWHGGPAPCEVCGGMKPDNGPKETA